MRISDWSSDVCSSDLDSGTEGKARGTAGATPAGGSGADGLAEVLEEGLDAQHAGAVLEGAAARLVDAQVVANVGHAEDLAEPDDRGGLLATLAAGVAEQADPIDPRLEGPQSETQSL